MFNRERHSESFLRTEMSVKKEEQEGDFNKLLGTLLVPQTPPNR